MCQHDINARSVTEPIIGYSSLPSVTCNGVPSVETDIERPYSDREVRGTRSTQDEKLFCIVHHQTVRGLVTGSPQVGAPDQIRSVRGPLGKTDIHLTTLKGRGHRAQCGRITRSEDRTAAIKVTCLIVGRGVTKIVPNTSRITGKGQGGVDHQGATCRDRNGC